jgi:hypothetical protein
VSISVNPSYCRCSRHNINVSLEQTEGECRETHDCGDGDCPLEGQFGQNNYTRALRFLMPTLASEWPSKD